MSVSLHTIQCLLSCLAEGDTDAMAILADALEEFGDERAELVRKHIGQTYIGRYAPVVFAFPELCDEALTVKGWNGIKRRWRQNFKERVKRIGLRYRYFSKEGGVLIISYASLKQLDQVKQARRVELDEWPNGRRQLFDNYPKYGDGIATSNTTADLFPEYPS